MEDLSIHDDVYVVNDIGNDEVDSDNSFDGYCSGSDAEENEDKLLFLRFMEKNVIC